MATYDFTPTNYVESLRSVIEQRIVAQWKDGSGNPLTDIAWPFGDYAPTPGTPWLKVDILYGQSTPMTMGESRGLNLNVGSIQLQVYAPKGKGAGDVLNSLTGSARAIFSRYFGSGLRCGASSLLPPQFNNAWAIATVTTPFEAFELQP